MNRSEAHGEECSADDGGGRLERDIRTAILTGNMGARERLKSCRAFSSQYGITYSRAQRVFKRLEREGLLYSRRGGGTFVAEAAVASRPANGPQAAAMSQTVATVITPRYTLDASLEHVMPTADVVCGAEAWLGQHQARLRVITEEDLTGGALDRLSAAEKRIVIGITMTDSAIDQLRPLALAGSLVVLIGRSPRHSNWALTIDTDGRTGIRMAVEHLRQFGHRRIGLLSLEADPDGALWWVQEREAGYADAMKGGGLTPLITRLPVDAQTPENRVRVGAALEAWLPDAVRGRDGLTALICVHDPLAEQVMNGCRRYGLGVPEDLSLVGYDDMPWAIGQGLTTLHRPYREAGELVADVVLRAMRHPGFSCRGPLYIAPRLVSRNSVAVPRR